LFLTSRTLPNGRHYFVKEPRLSLKVQGFLGPVCHLPMSFIISPPEITESGHCRWRLNLIVSPRFPNFLGDEDTYYFAYSFPYSYSQLQEYLSDLSLRSLPFFTRELLGYSIEKRRIECLTITDERGTSDTSYKKTVCITARVHPGESPASWVCQGIIEFLTSDHPKAIALRKGVCFKIMPMLNPDGVVLGNYRASSLGFDLNRYWKCPSLQHHPEIFYVKELFTRIQKTGNINLYLDIHAHSSLANTFICAFVS
jgi:murein tripeptide amidase MpaA